MKTAAKSLRKKPTPAEQALWEILRSFRADGFPFRRQVPMGRFVLDFYCAATRLAVEAYGSIHELDSVARRDAEREQILNEAYPIDILYMSNEQILNDPQTARELVIDALKKALPCQRKAADDLAIIPSPAERERGARRAG